MWNFLWAEAFRIDFGEHLLELHDNLRILNEFFKMWCFSKQFYVIFRISITFYVLTTFPIFVTLLLPFTFTSTGFLAQVWGGASESIFSSACTGKNCFGTFTTAGKYMETGIDAMVAAGGAAS